LKYDDILIEEREDVQKVSLGSGWMSCENRRTDIEWNAGIQVGKRTTLLCPAVRREWSREGHWQLWSSGN
jgi:hypothetical protein